MHVCQIHLIQPEKPVLLVLGRRVYAIQLASRYTFTGYDCASYWLSNARIDWFNLHKLLTIRIESRAYKVLYIFDTGVLSEPLIVGALLKTSGFN